FDFLAKHETGAGGEIQLTDAIQKLNEIQTVFAYDFEGKRHDVGVVDGFVKTTIEFALQHPELRDDILRELESILERHKAVK
ncbi:UTP--glucose-1-phosphate uridylyltransferase, partial [Peribacillus butanolivorans]